MPVLKTFMKDLSHLNKYFARYKWYLIIGSLFVIASNLFQVLQPQMIREALDLVIENIAVYQAIAGFELQAMLFKSLGRLLLFFGLTVLALAMIMGVFMYFMRQTIIVMSRLIEYDLRNEIFEHYQRLTLAFYKRNNTGDLMARISEDVSHVRMYVGPAVMYGINLVTLTILVIGSMLAVSPTMTAYVLLPLPVLSISIYYVSNLINKRSAAIQGQLSVLNSTAQEVYSGIRVVKSYVQERPMVRFFNQQSDEYKNQAMGLARIEAFFHPLMLLLIGISTLLTIYIGGVQAIKGNITAGNIAEFVIYVNMLTWPVTAIGWVASIIQRAAASQARINEFLREEPDLSFEKQAHYELEGAVKFDQVTFVYPDTGIKAIDGLSFELKPGEKMAIVGKTGSGKTTVADLIMRMYDVTSGQIAIDGRDVRQHDLQVLRQNIGYVPQDVFLFSDTIADNVRFGNPEADLNQVKDYTKYASIHDEIDALKEGFDTYVGERGVTLSGGQKQRISIARALIKQPNLLILDDCLSAVDTTTEQRILNYFETVLADKTAIIITHRIYSMLEFDKILVLEDGRLKEWGNHDSLMANKGYYYEMFERQQVENSNAAV